MTNKHRTLLVSILVLTAMIVCSCVPAFAATTFTARVLNGKLYILRGSSSYGTYSLKSTALTLSEEDGTLVLSFREQNESSASTVSLGATSSTYLTVSGTMDSFNIAESVTSKANITVSGTIGTVTVRGCPSVTVSATAQLTRLTIKNDDATVSVKTGATVGTTTGLTFNSASYQPQSGSIATYLSVTVSQNPTYAASISYNDSNCTVTVTGNASGVTLGQVIRDITPYVYRVSNDTRISGSWKWAKGTGTTTDSGSYIYQFTPSSSSYEGQNLYINFTAYGDRVQSNNGHSNGNSHNNNNNNNNHSTSSKKQPTLSITKKNSTYLKSFSFDSSNNVLTMTPNSGGVALRSALSSLNLSVTYDGSTVDGSWAWTSGSATTSTAGTYAYTFTPTSSRYQSLTLTIVYKSSTSSSSPVTVSASSRGTSNYTSKISYDSSSRTLTLVSNSSDVTLLQAVSDVLFSASYNGSTVGGSWSFSSSASTTTAGTYTYTFKPTSSRYQSSSITIVFSHPANSSKPNYDKNQPDKNQPNQNQPNYNQPDKNQPNQNQPNYNQPGNNPQNDKDKNNGKDNNKNNNNQSKPSSSKTKQLSVKENSTGNNQRTIQVSIPSDVQSGDKLQILLNGNVIATYNLNDSSAGKSNRYNVNSSGTITAQIIYQ